MLLIFDLDGTLFRSHLCIITAVNSTLEKLNLPPVTEEAVMKLIGEKYDAFTEGFAPGFKDKERLIELYTQSEHETISHQAKLFDGVFEMLETLRKDGHKLVLCSNGSMEYIELALRSSRIYDMFDMRVSGGDFKSKTEAVAYIMEQFPEKPCAVTGDRFHDIQAARENGITSIGAYYGYGQPSELEIADHHVFSPLEILDVVKKQS